MGLIVSALIIMNALIAVCSKDFKWPATIIFCVSFIGATVMLIFGAIK